MREVLKGQGLSFTEIAKIVGERWQVLSPEAREACESQANAAKEKYYPELAEYKKTPQYDAYQKYLEEFKAKHAAPPKGTESKRSKLEPETSVSTMSTRSGSHDLAERIPNRKIGSCLLEDYSVVSQRSGSSPPTGPQKPLAPPHTKSTSPVTYTLSSFNSPRMAEHYPPVSASLRSATLQKETSFDYSSGASSAYAPESTLSYAPSYSHAYRSASTPSQASSYTSQLYSPVDLPSRRPFREMPALPGLSSEDTTLSSHSGMSLSPGSHYTFPTSPYQESSLPILEAPKSQRVLPAPILNPSALPSPLDARVTKIQAASPPLNEYRNTSSLAALLRAGELAHSADQQQQQQQQPGGKEDSPLR